MGAGVGVCICGDVVFGMEVGVVVDVIRGAAVAVVVAVAVAIVVTVAEAVAVAVGLAIVSLLAVDVEAWLPDKSCGQDNKPGACRQSWHARYLRESAQLIQYMTNKSTVLGNNDRNPS